MKLTITAPYLFLVAATLAVLSTEAATLRGGQSLAVVDLSQDSLDLEHPSGDLSRRLKENEEEDEEANEEVDEDEKENEEQDEGQDEEEEDEEEQSAESEEENEENANEESEEDNSAEQEESDNSSESQEDVTEGEEVDGWDLQAYTDKYSEKYKSMSMTSKIWTTILAVWGSILVMTSFYLLCCRKGFKPDKSLMESMKQSLIDEQPHPVHQI